MTRDALPVLIGTRRYLIEPTLFSRQNINNVRNRVDVGESPVSRALIQEYKWTRSFTDFRNGSGQEFPDVDDSEPHRFRTIAGARYRDPRRLVLAENHEAEFTAPEAGDAHPSGGYGEGRYIVQGRTRFYFVVDYDSGGDSSKLYEFFRTSGSYTSQSPSNANPTGGNTIFAFFYRRSGNKIYWVRSDNGIYGNNVLEDATVTAREMWSTEEYIFGRSNGQGSWRWEDPSDFSTPLGSFALPYDASNLNDIRGVVQTPVGIYVAQSSDVRSLIFMHTVDASGSLSAPSNFTEMPPGEWIKDMVYHSGFVVIATTRGIRVARIQSDRTLLYGPLIGPANTIYQLAAGIDGVYAAAGRGTGMLPTGISAGITGPIVIFLDLGFLVDDLAPAWSIFMFDDDTDLGDAVGVAHLSQDDDGNHRPTIAVLFTGDPAGGLGPTIRAYPLRLDGNSLEGTRTKMILQTGRISFGRPHDNKRLHEIRLDRTNIPNLDSVSLIAFKNGINTVHNLGTPDETVAPAVNLRQDIWRPSIAAGRDFDLRFTIELTSSSDIFEAHSVEMDVVPDQDKDNRIVLPVYLAESINYRGNRIGLDVDDELTYLLGLSGIVNYEIGGESGTAKVDSVTVQENPRAKFIQPTGDVQTIVSVELITV